MSSPRMAAMTVLISGRGEIGMVGATAGSMTLSVIAALDEA